MIYNNITLVPLINQNINKTNIEFIFYPSISIRVNLTIVEQMSIAASAENTMFKKIENKEEEKNEEVQNEEVINKEKVNVN